MTGAAGFIGYHVAESLLARGETVLGWDNLSPYYDVALKEARLDRLRARTGFEFARCDVGDRSAVAGLFGGAARVASLRASGCARRRQHLRPGTDARRARCDGDSAARRMRLSTLLNQVSTLNSQV